MIFLFLLAPYLWAIEQPIEQTISEASFNAAITEGLKKVSEFELIKQKAKELGVRIYLFGGTAASFAHYVRWDLKRKQGDHRFYDDRFDFDFTNIFRASQDSDLVVDGPVAAAIELENFVQEKMQHLLGTKAKWEIRLLREKRGDKEALLGDKQFQDQHTDSHSVGMIEITDPPTEEGRVRDLKDWASRSPQFLQDVLNGKLRFYFSALHETTKRFKRGENPAIFSVVRYFTNLVRFELEPDPRDRKILKKLIDDFKSEQIKTDYALHWFEKNPKKLVLHAIDLQKGWNEIDSIGLRKKLVEFGDSNLVNSMSWWLNRSPLASKPVGEGKGKTAAELGIDQVAHDTQTIEAYEILTYSHRGLANVLESREHVQGERAALGNGFYSMRGKRGAWGSGLTIRFQVNPEAREGTDFVLDGEVVLFKNRNALRVIEANIPLSPRDYIELLESQRFSHLDRGPMEKFKRRMRAKNMQISAEDVGWLAKKAKSLFAMPAGLKKYVLSEIFKLMRGNRDFIEAMGISPKFFVSMLSTTEDSQLLKFMISNRDWFSAHPDWSSIERAIPKRFPLMQTDVWLRLMKFFEKIPRADSLRAQMIESFDQSIVEKLEAARKKMEAPLLRSLIHKDTYVQGFAHLDPDTIIHSANLGGVDMNPTIAGFEEAGQIKSSQEIVGKLLLAYPFPKLQKWVIDEFLADRVTILTATTGLRSMLRSADLSPFHHQLEEAFRNSLKKGAQLEGEFVSEILSNASLENSKIPILAIQSLKYPGNFDAKQIDQLKSPELLLALLERYSEIGGYHLHSRALIAAFNRNPAALKLLAERSPEAMRRFQKASRAILSTPENTRTLDLRSRWQFLRTSVSFILRPHSGAIPSYVKASGDSDLISCSKILRKLSSKP